MKRLVGVVSLIAIIVSVVLTAHASVRPRQTQNKVQPTAVAAPASRGASYESGRECYDRVRKSPRLKRKKREWQRCIDIFAKVARSQAGSPQGAQASYSVARLSREKYFNTRGSKSDVTEALQYYNRVVSEYPKSNLADDALYNIAALRLRTGEKARAKKALKALLKRYPRSDYAPTARKMLKEMDAPKKTERVETVVAYEQITYDEPAYRAPRNADPTTTPLPQPTFEYSDKPASGKDPGLLVEVAHEQRQDDTVVTLFFNRPVEYKAIFDSGKQRRRSRPKLEVQLKETHPFIELPRKLNVSSLMVKRIKIAQRILGGTNVDIQLKRDVDYTIKPYQRSLDIIFSEADRGQPNTRRPTVMPKYNMVATEVMAVAVVEEGPLPKPAPEVHPSKTRAFLNKMAFWKGKKKDGQLRIVLDPGHGGEEDGAVGPHGVREKDVTLQIAQMTAEQLRTQLGAKVWLTRTKDKNLSLEKRYKIAKKKKADIFISIHANASPNHKHKGIETYYLNNASDEAAMKLAARENQSWKGPRSDIDQVLSTMMQNAVTDESRELATSVHTNIVKNVKSRYKGVRDRKVRSGLFYVLVGTQCPSILVESSFITNPREEMRLADPTYQQQIADAIVAGVRTYEDASHGRMANL